VKTLAHVKNLVNVMIIVIADVRKKNSCG